MLFYTINNHLILLIITVDVANYRCIILFLWIDGLFNEGEGLFDHSRQHCLTRHITIIISSVLFYMSHAARCPATWASKI